LGEESPKPAIQVRTHQVDVPNRVSQEAPGDAIDKGSVPGFSRPHPFLGGLRGLTPMKNYGQRIQSKTSKRKRFMRQSPKETGHKLLGPLPMESHWMCSVFPAVSCDNK
jgi:hypothetical protein